ncbi:receptor kinase-like protein Xa21 [Diospyros lotus]|uniref:receptor kinase-like protein Xa21 n=1 Tax=Diospyros lotus TaxID=55363 RepID=UPI0022528729|nr:receptor kinase-like protein Xa21 [Diospyros lotus]
MFNYPIFMEKTYFHHPTILSLALCFLATLSIAATTNYTTDQSALLAFKDHVTYDPNGILANNWSTATSICNWTGVSCSMNPLRVTALNIPEMGLRGTIPPDVGNLSFLAHFNISNNNFHGLLPSELARLHQLKVVNFNVNNFSGEVPSWFGVLPQLQYLLLANNSFTGPIPSTIFRAPSLQHIEFTYNKLSGGLPEDFCLRLPKLEYLFLSGNELYGQIPSTIGACRELKVISLSTNKFNSFIPKEIGNLTMLQELYLADNNLRGEIPQEMGNLHSLKTLSVAVNNLTGHIPSSIFNISSLKGLYLEKNNLLGTLPVDMCMYVPNLQVVSLRRNKLKGSIPREIGNCTSLTELSLSENQFSGSISPEIGILQNLERLQLSSNNLNGPIPAIIFNVSRLQIISIEENQLSGKLPSNFGLSLPNLTELYLGGNNLQGAIPDSISNASKLTYLGLTSNSFTGPIPNSLGNLRFLEQLHLGSNNLTSENSSPEQSFLISLENCKNLKVLWISRNPLNAILPVSIGNLSTSVRSIFASYCGFRGTIPSEIGNLSNVAFLHLENNDLTGFIPTTVFKDLWKLQVLNIHGNKFQGSISADLCNLKNLGALYLQKNKLSGSIPACLGNLTSIRHLSLSSNKLTSGIPTSLWNLAYLLKMNLSSNSLSGHLSPLIGNLKVATTIDLSMNRFSGPIPVTIGGLQSLVNLSLAHNQFAGPIPESIGNLLSMEFIDLSHNNLSGAIPKSFEALSQLQRFNVSFNNLRGGIPQGGPFANFTIQSFIGNEALCDAPQLQLPPCIAGSTHKSGRKRILLIICTPVLIASILLTLTSVLALRKCQMRSKQTTQSVMLSTLTVKKFTYQELVQATDGFSDSNLLGMGSFGSVYKGTFLDGGTLAIKVFNLQLEGAFKSFDTECEMLRNIRHRNLIKVISSCSNLDFKAIVLDYMPNGSLEKWLYSHNYFLDILQRLEIMIDVACALEYLHHSYSTPVVHRDLKPSNVLLDEDMVAYVSDFGIAKFLANGDSMQQTKTIATFGYIAPEYGLEGLVSTKCDVYSFGIMLIETFTRTKPTDAMFAGDLSLKRWVEKSLPNALSQVIDASLLRPEEEHYTAKVRCVSSILGLALNCSAESAEARMNIKDVVAALKKIRLLFLETVKGP